MIPAKPRVAMVGMGALGIMFGEYIAEQIGLKQVTFIVDDARKARYRQTSVSLNGKACHFQFATPQEYGASADIVMVAVKYTALPQAIELIKPIVGKDTIVLSLLNGITSEEMILKAIPGSKVIYCVSQGMDARRVDHDVVYKNLGYLCLGLPKEHIETSAALFELETFFQSINFPFVHEEDIMHRMWCKWMFNIGVNQVVAAHAGTFKTVQEEGPIRERFIEAMREVVRVAQAYGINLTEDDVNTYLNILTTLDPEGMPSLRQDTLAHRYTEVEMFAGTLIEKAKQVGIRVPVNESLLSDIRAIEAAYPRSEA